MSQKRPSIETDVLIIGTGPAGAATAATLSTYGIDNMVVNKFAWTARTPRAHITNQRTLEVIRDLDLDWEVEKYSYSNVGYMGENPFCASLAGEEFGRIQTWGTHPARKADYEMASPTEYCDITQNWLEPILIRSAAHKGSKVRFDTEYVSHKQDKNGVTTILHDRLSGTELEVRSKYLVGADGANSKVVEDAGLPLEGKMGLSGSINMVFDADLSQYVAHRPSVLYWIVQPGSNMGGLGIGVVRMVRPWNRWLAIWGYDVEQGPPEVTEEFALGILHRLIGDDTIPIKIESTSTWTVNSCYASRIQNGRVFCAGDAIHRHSPMNGLGSNTSVQDGYNLGWKLAYVLNGKAGESLLDTYDQERAPVAEQIVKRATKSIEEMHPVFHALGLLDAKSPKEMVSNMAKRKGSTKKAAEQRKHLRDAIASTDYIYNAHGVEMNMRYGDSDAVYPDGSAEEEFKRDKELYAQASSRPGAHVPHAWLIKDGHKISTLDLCGKGKFSILTGIGGEGWQEAAKAVEEALGIDCVVHIIGPGQQYEDPYGDFARLRDTSETGALVMRPDLIVCHRAQEYSKTATDDLLTALSAVLGLNEAAPALKAAAGK